MRTFIINCIVVFTLTYSVFHWNIFALPYSAISTSLFFLVVFFLLWLASFLYNRSYFRKVPLAIGLAFFFIKELLVANIKVAYDILTPHYYMRPTVIALPLSVRSKLEITMLANMITLTPGTLSIDVSADRKVLYVHALYVKNNDVELLKRHIKHGFERRIMKLTA